MTVGEVLAMAEVLAPVIDAAEVDAAIERSWARGDSIGETRLTVQRQTGTKPAAHEVQRIFAALSHQAAGLCPAESVAA